MAAARGRYGLLHFESGSSFRGFESDSEQAFESEILRTNVATSLFAERVDLMPISLGDQFLRWHFPEPLQWLSVINGGASIHEMAAEGDAYAGDTFAARVKFMPQFVLCRQDGRPVGLAASYQQGRQQDFVTEVESLVEMAKRFDVALARATSLTGAERARTLHEALELLDPTICMMAFADELRDLAALDADDEFGFGEQARELLEQRRFRIAQQAVWDVVSRDSGSISAERARILLPPLRKRFAEQPDVLQFIAMIQAGSDIRLAMHEPQWQRIREDVLAAVALAPDSQVVPALEQILKLVEAEGK